MDTRITENSMNRKRNNHRQVGMENMYIWNQLFHVIKLNIDYSPLNVLLRWTVFEEAKNWLYLGIFSS